MNGCDYWRIGCAFCFVRIRLSLIFHRRCCPRSDMTYSGGTRTGSSIRELVDVLRSSEIAGEPVAVYSNHYTTSEISRRVSKSLACYPIASIAAVYIFTHDVLTQCAAVLNRTTYRTVGLSPMHHLGRSHIASMCPCSEGGTSSFPSFNQASCSDAVQGIGRHPWGKTRIPKTNRVGRLELHNRLAKLGLEYGLAALSYPASR